MTKPKSAKMKIDEEMKSIHNISKATKLKIKKSTSKCNGEGKVKIPGKRGRKPLQIDEAVKLQRSRQSAKDCRARKKVRYQGLADAVSKQENENLALIREYQMFRKLFTDIDSGVIQREVLLYFNLDMS